MRTFLVRGIRVIVYPMGVVQIQARNKQSADKIRKYLRDEGIIP